MPKKQDTENTVVKDKKVKTVIKPQQTPVPAVVVLGSKQFVVKDGELLIVEKLTNKDSETFVTDDILHGKKVTCTVIGPIAGQKIDILKFKNKTRYMRRIGHRQKYTQVRVTSIV